MKITKEIAAQIEAENGLPEGCFAWGRLATEAESIYLRVDSITRFAFHFETLPGRCALLIYDFGQVSHTWDPLLNTGINEEDPQGPENEMWAALTMAREGSTQAHIKEHVSVVLTGAAPEPNYRWSWSIPGISIRGIFYQAPRSILLGPVFRSVPEEAQGEGGPGLCLEGLEVSRVFAAQSIRFQGVEKLKHLGAKDLYDLAMELRLTP